jgi:hypothetical protein
MGSSAYNCFLTFQDPNSGQTAGVPNAPVVVATNVHANVTPWRSKEIDKDQSRIGQSSYKAVIHFPQTFSVNTGMEIVWNGNTGEVDSAYDPDGQHVELHIYFWINNATFGGS